MGRTCLSSPVRTVSPLLVENGAVSAIPPALRHQLPLCHGRRLVSSWALPGTHLFTRETRRVKSSL